MSSQRIPHSTNIIPRNTPPLSPATTTPSSSEQSLCSSSDDTALSTTFEKLRVGDESGSDLSPREKQRIDQVCFGQGYERGRQQLPLSDDSMFEMKLKRESPMGTPCGTPSQRSRPSLQHSHSSFLARTPCSSLTSSERERPALLHRNTSYSKRHASLDTPREVPCQSMHSRAQKLNNNEHQPHRQEGPGEFYREHMGKGTSGISNEQITGAPSSSDPSSLGFPPNPDSALLEPTQQQPQRPFSPAAMESSEEGMPSTSALKTSPMPSPQHYQRRNISSNVPVQGGRPISAQEPARPIYSPTPIRPSDFDRSSTLSLPAQMDTPFHTLPTNPQHDPSTSSPDDSSTSSLSTSPSTSASTTSLSPASSSTSLSSRRPGYMTRDSTVTKGPSSSPSVYTQTTADSSYLYPPVPPTVLTPPPPPARDGQYHAPHEPFLAHQTTRSPEIHVETTRMDYKLIIRLPGYRRDSITLSSRRRRILHVVADSWEPGGGHLERRVSFGYDADLTQVRAEFDGEYLRVTVPRRITPMTYIDT